MATKHRPKMHLALCDYSQLEACELWSLGGAWSICGVCGVCDVWSAWPAAASEHENRWTLRRLSRGSLCLGLSLPSTLWETPESLMHHENMAFKWPSYDLQNRRPPLILIILRQLSLHRLFQRLVFTCTTILHAHTPSFIKFYVKARVSE